MASSLPCEHNQKKVTVQFGRRGRSLFFFVVFSLNVNRPSDVEHRIDDIDSQSRQRDEDRQFHEHHLPLPESAGKCYFKKAAFPGASSVHSKECCRPCVGREHDHLHLQYSAFTAGFSGNYRISYHLTKYNKNPHSFAEAVRGFAFYAALTTPFSTR